MKALNIVLAVLGGAIAGATVGLLLAPEKGENTRKNIVKYLESKGIKLQKSKLEELADEIISEKINTTIQSTALCQTYLHSMLSSVAQSSEPEPQFSLLPRKAKTYAHVSLNFSVRKAFCAPTTKSTHSLSN